MTEIQPHLEFDPEGEKKSQAIQLLLKLFGNSTTDETWRNALRGRNEKQGLVVIVRGKEVLAACIYETAEQDEKKVILLRSMQGKSDSIGVNWKAHMTEFEAYAKASGCTDIIIHGRTAWLRLGWETIFVAVRKAL